MEDIDSLEEIRAIMDGGSGDGNGNSTGNNNNNNNNNNNVLGANGDNSDEPSYPLITESDLSSFGIGISSSSNSSGRISDIIDPGFRPPSIVTTSQTLGELLGGLANSSQPYTYSATAGTTSTTPTTATSSFTADTAAAAFSPFDNLIYDANSPFNPTTSAQTDSGLRTAPTVIAPVSIANQLTAPRTSLDSFKIQSDTAMTFSSIAEQATSTTNSANINVSGCISGSLGNADFTSLSKDSIMSSTLLEYGLPSNWQLQQTTSANIPYRDPSRPTPMGPIFDIRAPRAPAPTPASLFLTAKPSSGPGSIQINLLSTSRNQDTTSSSLNDVSDTNNNRSHTSPLDDLPPSDERDTRASSSRVPQRKRTDHTSGKIPKVTSSSSTSHERIDVMDLPTLIAKYRDYETRQKASVKKRYEIESFLSDFARKAHGKNFELDSKFRRAKEEQQNCEASINEYKSLMTRISAKLLSKFDHRILQKPDQPNAKPKRAKMSTGSAPNKDKERSSKESRFSGYLLNLGDTSTWCQTCDMHFDTLKQYCEHIHDRSCRHGAAILKSAPWRLTDNPTHKERTYDILKSICSKISHENDDNFTVQIIDGIVNPTNLGNRERILKQRVLERERGKFDLSDPLLKMKGYDHLVPINGYYCSLCNCALCDYAHVEQHMRSFEHNNKHARVVHGNPQHEISFRKRRERSYEKLNPTSEPASLQGDSSSTCSKAPSKTTNTGALPPLQYKKSTSHIVDEHEVIADRFPKKSLPEKAATAVLAKQTTSSIGGRRSAPDELEDEDARLLKRAAYVSPNKRKAVPSTEIVPIGDSRTKPAALKRLRNDRNQRVAVPSAAALEPESSPDVGPSPEFPMVASTSKPYQSPSSDDGSDDIQFIEEVHLNSGDPDSPFPDLELSVTGNVHMDVLKDKRLATPIKIILPKLNLDDYKDILMDSTTMWARVNRMMTKKEPKNLKRDLNERLSTKPTYFNLEGENIAVDID